MLRAPPEQVEEKAQLFAGRGDADYLRSVRQATDEVAAFIEAARKDDPAADGLERKLAPLVDALRVTTNPVPLKGALAALGATRPDVRAPLLRLDTRQRTALERSLTLARLLVPS